MQQTPPPYPSEEEWPLLPHINDWGILARFGDISNTTTTLIIRKWGTSS